MGSIENELFVLQDVPGKGKGLIATEDLEPGTLILSEKPLFTTESLSDPATIEKDLGSIVRSLPKEGQRSFLSLHNNHPGAEPFSNIVRSNACKCDGVDASSRSYDSDLGNLLTLGSCSLTRSARPFQRGRRSVPPGRQDQSQLPTKRPALLA